VIKFRRTFHFLLLATLTLMIVFLSECKRKDRDNETGNSRETVCENEMQKEL
jgi:hypothetical protein